MKTFLSIYFTLVILLLGLKTNAQLEVVREGDLYPFWRYFPPGYSDTSARFPLLLFLHGRSLCGTDIEKVNKYGPIYEMKRGMPLPFVTVSPQTPCGKQWNPDKVNLVVNYALKHFNLDTNRIYVVGMSMGGYGVLHYVGKYAYRIAAAAAFCGGGNVSDACNMKNMPLWLMHGRKDNIVPLSESQVIYDAIHACGGNLVYFSIYPNYGHGELAWVFRYNELYKWLLSNTLGKPGNPPVPQEGTEIPETKASQ